MIFDFVTIYNIQLIADRVSTATCCYFFQADAGNEVNNELANRMSLFYASATPMLKTLSDATSKFVADVSPSVDYIYASYVLSFSMN